MRRVPVNGPSKQAPREGLKDKLVPGQSWKELKERGLRFLWPIPPAANLSPNEEAAGTSELAGSSLTAN